MLSASVVTLLKVFKTTSPQKLFNYDCVTLYISCHISYISVIPGYSHVQMYRDVNVLYNVHIVQDIYSVMHSDGSSFKTVSFQQAITYKLMI